MDGELPLDARIADVSRDIRDAGGRAVIVGGWVRDYLLGRDSKDVDIEVYGLEADALETLLSRWGKVETIGRSFGVFKVHGLDVDFSLPRRDSKVFAGHKGFEVRVDPDLSFEEAARRRDLTINSIGLDPLSGQVIDPHRGREDLEARRLRATDPSHFSEDPLRGVRVAQLAARFEMKPDDELKTLCAALDLSELSAERLLEEFRKLLLKGVRPSRGLAFLEQTSLLRFFPELAALVGVPQDAIWHPEGDVWVHTLMVVDEAARLRDDGADDEALVFAALCHDLGKPATTEVGDDGRVRSPSHESVGVPIAARFLERIRAPRDLIARVGALVANHLAPALFVKNGAGPRGYRRLARDLGAVGVSLELLVRLARADHLGRTTRQARERIFPAGDRFLERARTLLVERTGPTDVVMGRHLIARGLRPGPDFGRILERCRDVQDDTGWTDADRILDHVLANAADAAESD